MALFDLEQHFEGGPPTGGQTQWFPWGGTEGADPGGAVLPSGWKRPTFKDCLAADIKLAFFNESEFAERHNVDGVDALIVLEDVDVREHASHWEAGAKQDFDTGLYDAYRILYIQVEDYGEMPMSGNLVTIDEGTRDEQMFTLVSCEEEAGVYRMILERTRQG